MDSPELDPPPQQRPAEVASIGFAQTIISEEPMQTVETAPAPISLKGVVKGGYEWLIGKSKEPEELAAQMKERLVDEYGRWKRGTLADKKAMQDMRSEMADVCNPRGEVSLYEPLCSLLWWA
jgi:hypothetical protein